MFFMMPDSPFSPLTPVQAYYVSCNAFCKICKILQACLAKLAITACTFLDLRKFYFVAKLQLLNVPSQTCLPFRHLFLRTVD